MTNEERAALLGDELTQAIRAYVATPSDETLGTFCALLINRCASMAAAAVLGLHTRLDAVERRGAPDG